MMVDFPAAPAFAIRLDGPPPHTLQSARGVAVRGGRVHFYTKARARADFARLTAAFHAKLPPGWIPLPGPCRVRMLFAFPLPRDVVRSALGEELLPHVGKIDCDNLGKGVADCLTRAGVWVDDGGAVQWVLEKGRSAIPRLEVTIWQGRVAVQGTLF